jgi:hypothetical protein
VTARTIIRGLYGTPDDGLWRVECHGEEGETWRAILATYVSAWETEQRHQRSAFHRDHCLPRPMVEVVEASPEEWPPAGYLGPSWDDLLPTPPAPPKPRGRVLVGAARALVGTVSGRPS